ncbi:hypothetical protein [Pelagibacterium sp. H642]|uniref:hypothetical protein n=1 Tax=Pelagibacterium sp. H642 TaxID=1881069 RepID=UPI0028168C37|nr:hypothetical protein [Pelagibacterium sp. H642]WMT92829.1 hypothetical protein NO934_18790 [Pelagibacterium sp. H642]
MHSRINSPRQTLFVVERSHLWPIRIFLVSLVIPWLVNIGPVTLSLYRIVLLGALLPCLYNWLSGKCGRIRLSDAAVFMFCLWGSLSTIVTRGAGAAVEPAGILVIETAGAYLLARCYIRSAADYRSMAILFVGVTLSILPLAAIESISGQSVALDIYGIVLPTIPEAFEGMRMGLRRAQGVYEHPILLGVNAACAFALAYLVAGNGSPFWRRTFLAGAVALTAAFSLSSAPLGVIALQFALIAWNGTMRAVPQRWLVLWSTALVLFLLIEGFSNRSAIELYISYLSFNPYNGWYRMLIWQYGTAAVMSAPWFGIGFADWPRPDWMTPSVDNFWLAMAMRHGLPAVLFLLAALLAATIAVLRRRADAVIYRYRLAYLAVLGGLFMVGCTVHFWNSSHVLFMFMLGSGLWISEAEQSSATEMDRPPRALRGGIGVSGLRPLAM